MEYRNLIQDFASRTLKNLDHIQAQAALGSQDVYPVTQLWNSLLGLVVAPREREMNRIPSTPMAQLWALGWPRLTTVVGSEPATLNDLLRDLRNAVAHFNVEFIAEAGSEIDTVEVWNQAPRGKAEVKWKARISVGDLESLARQVANLYLEEFSSSAA